ncbi:MAG TPA: MBL fold metallo-hydrolase [Trebonia sp.]|nr:MBL fold metallo-hydrolase [Trebonia sp.]
MRLTVVGCAGSFPGADSPASCYLLEADGFRLVVDLGNGALGALQKYIGLFDVDAVCLSHLHADHCVDMYSYAIAREYAPGGAKDPIPVYGPAGTRDRIAAIHGPGDGGGSLMERFAFETLAPGTREIGPFQVSLAHMNHPVETFGFRFAHESQSIVYSGDTGLTDALVPLARGANVLICEASFTEGPGLPADLHLTGRQAAEYARQAGVRQLVLTHLQAWNEPRTTFDEAAAAFAGGLMLAYPGQVVDPRAR